MFLLSATNRCSGDGRFTMVFNGEVFNYREMRQELKAIRFSFHTDSDTDMLLAAWALWVIDGLRRLTGMFTSAYYDHHDESLTLVRESFGIKSLYYQQDASVIRLVYAIPAILCLLEEETELNYQHAYDYSEFSIYYNADDNLYQGIDHVVPRHFLRVVLKSSRAGEAQRWWWPLIEEHTDLSFDDAEGRARH